MGLSCRFWLERLDFWQISLYWFIVWSCKKGDYIHSHITFEVQIKVLWLWSSYCRTGGRRCYYIEILHLRGVSGYQWQWKAFCKALAHARPQGINLLSRSLGVATYPYLNLHGTLCSWKIQCVTHVARRVSLVSLASLVSYPKPIIYQRHRGIICKDRRNEAAKMACHILSKHPNDLRQLQK